MTERLLGSLLIRNDVRGELAEEIVGLALEPEWRLCAGDWAAFDLQQTNGPLRIQVKQSAAIQSWHNGESPSARPCFSIASKTGRWEGSTWIAESSRNADIYVFGWHPRTDAEADHRDPDQWLFYVVAEVALPQQKSISLNVLARLAQPCPFSTLRESVEAVVAHLP
ncbi:MAG: hypothetical protein ABR588_10670 [Sphingomicrobium sp.]|nr:hypothetical protein [Sphingomonadales bacterium]